MRELTYTVTDLPPVWPGKRTSYPKAAPFKSQWTKTQHMLAREISHLGGRKVEIALELPRGAMDLRQDGQMKADARPKAAVIVSFIDNDGQRHAYPCDRFAWWQDNLYAIAVVLEDLRRAERYGVQSSLIRAGFKALPAPGQTTNTISADAAASIVASFSIYDSQSVRTDREVAKKAIREAVNRTHPDRNAGDRKYFDEIQTAKRVLEAHHGGSL